MGDDELKILTFGGRPFRMIDFDRRSALQDATIQKALHATGIDTVVPMDGDSDDAYLARLQESLNDSLRQFELLGAFLLPPHIADAELPNEYSPAIAAETAGHLERVTTAAEREALMPLALHGLGEYLAARRRTVEWFPKLFTRRGEKRERSRADELPDGLGLGEWSEIVRIVSRWDYDRARNSVHHWPLVALLESYENLLREQAYKQYQHDVLVWAVLAPHAKKGKQPPKLPAILQDTDG